MVTHPSTRHRHRSFAVRTLVLCALISSCDSPPARSKSHSSPSAGPSPELAAARIDLATSRLSANAPDEALAFAVAALEADPQSAEGNALVGEILASTRWHLPEITLKHPLQIDHINFADPSSLWVGLSGDSNSIVRWNLESLKIESVLFPIHTPESRSITFDPSHRSLVIERAGIALLCNAQSLKPVRDIGPLPDFVTPSATVVFSADGLLLAHPAYATDKPTSLVWHLRDTTSGEIIRSSEPSPLEHPAPLAAFLDRTKLRVLHADGSLLDMPVSPAQAITATPAETPLSLLHAQFAQTGEAALTLKKPSPHHRPEPFIVSFGGKSDFSLEPAALLARFPWSRHPGLWSGLLQEPEQSGFDITDRTYRFLSESSAPLHAASPVTAVTCSGDQWLVGEKNGTLTIHRTLPLPLAAGNAAKSATYDGKSLTSLRNLAVFLTGVRLDESSRSFGRIPTRQRMDAYASCDFDSLLRILPTLDFSPLVTAMDSLQLRSAAPEASLPLWDRIARADPTGDSWPFLLDKSADLSESSWHKELSTAVAARKSKTPVDPDSSPWLAADTIERIFDGEDTAAIESAIRANGGKSAAAAKALELALASVHPEWIEACLAHAVDLPPMLRKLAVSRIAWLKGRKADALAPWPDVLPDLQHVRLREDWDGWEQADFNQAFEKLRLCVNEELAAIEVPENPTPDQRKAIAARLNDPATLKAVGRERFAKACLKAALVFAAFKDETATTFMLASRARDLGEPPAPCLRAEAIALTALGDYQNAHDRWITLITEHPVKDQQPGDYAEAAYTSFENADPRQAMAVLTTGLHRFPNDANFALRAGWVALLTGNAERAYRFLLTGRQIGYPPEKLENALALLAISAAQTGAAEDADAFYQDLIRLDADWENPETIESLAWPEELKASLRQLLW